MRIILAFFLFLFLRVFEIAVLPAAVSFFMPLSTWCASFLFAVLPLWSAVVIAVGVVATEPLFAHAHPWFFTFLAAGTAVTALSIRILFSREGAVGNIITLIGGLGTVRVVGPFLWLLIIGGAGDTSFFIQFFRMIGWNNVLLDAAFITLVAYVLIRRERGRRAIRNTYV